MKTSIIQKALGVQWQHLPEALKKHYLENDKGENRAQGHLTIDFSLVYENSLIHTQIFWSSHQQARKQFAHKCVPSCF